MLNLHFSNRTEALAERLLAELAAAPGGPFAVDHVIVPSLALRRWLTLAMARQAGICANVRFDFLAQWLWRQLSRLVPRARPENPLAPALLAWRVHAAFGDSAWVARHPRLAHYLADGDAVMRHELAQRTAALLEPYTSYRPDWLDAWLQGRRIGAGHVDEDWQAELWCRLAADLDAADRHPVAAFVDALHRGGAEAARAAGLPPRVHVFAPPAMPPLHQQLLAQLGRVIEVDVYVLNPCREYWFELVDRRRLAHLAARGRAAGHEEGNRLLAAWGQQTQALVDGLVELGGATVDCEVADDGDYRPHPGHTLLASLQNAILDLQPVAPGSITLADDDRSLELHVCHSRTRELEVLHDRLLALRRADPTLQPADILIVTPDLEATAPLVDAVFGSMPADRHLPYTLTGRARSRVNAPARALLDLLALLGSRMPASAVHGLLQQPVVARRFGFGADDLALAHDWLLAAGVHWGLDGAHRGALGLPADERHTLGDGLARLLLGHALPAGVPEPLAGQLPAADIGAGDAPLLGRLWAFVDALRQAHAALAGPWPPARWVEQLRAACARFIDAQGDERADLRELLDTLGQLGDEMQQAGLADTLPLPVLRLALQQRLDDPARGGVPTGSITVSALGSLRALPYRVVCVIGLDDGLFPGAQRPAEFDLMAAQPRRGDRQRRLDERNLFLDLLLAARSHLHLSHTGRSVRDNAPLPPSVLVADLLDLLLPAIATDPGDRTALQAARRRLVVEHPLQPFSPQAFAVDGDPRLRSHARELAEALRRALQQAPVLPAAEPSAPPADDDDDDADEADDEAGLAVSEQPPFFTAPLPPPGAEWRRVGVEQLVAFFRHPSRYLLRQRLGLSLHHDGDELADDEPLLADGAGRRALADRLLPALLAGADAAQALRLAEAGTEWPGGPIGQLQLARELAQLQAFAARVRTATALPPLEPRVVEQAFDVDGLAWTLRIPLAGLRPDGLLRWRCAELDVRDRLEAWIHHLALCVAAPAGVALRTTWLARRETLAFGPEPDARAHLADLLALYGQGLVRPLPFYPRTAWVLVEGDLDRARAAWAPTTDRPWTEGADAAHRLALRGRADPLDAAFVDTAHRVLDPLRAALAGQEAA